MNQQGLIWHTHTPLRLDPILHRRNIIINRCFANLPCHHDDLFALTTRSNMSCDSEMTKELTSQPVCYHGNKNLNDNRITIATDLVTRVRAPTPSPKK